MKNLIVSIVAFVAIATCFNSCQTYSAVKSLAFPDKDYMRIVTKDNQVYVGKASLPKITTKKIKIKIAEDSVMEVESVNIAYLQAWHEGQESENGYKMIYTPVKEFKSVKDDDNLDYKTRDRERWLLEVINEKNLSLYFEHQEYDLKKDGEISGKSTGAGMVPNVWYYVKRAGEDIPTKIALSSRSVMNSNVYFKNWGPKYFKDCPVMVEQIRGNKLKSNDISDVVNYYIKECK